MKIDANLGRSVMLDESRNDLARLRQEMKGIKSKIIETANGKKITAEKLEYYENLAFKLEKKNKDYQMVI